MFSSKQGPSETLAQWRARLDHLAMELRTEARHRLLVLEDKDNEHYVEGSLKLIGEFLKGTLISGLRDERIRVIVKAKGEDDSLAHIIETAIQEESELKSQRYRNPQQNPQWYPRNRPVKQERIGRSHPGGSQEPSIKREVMAASALKNCYNCLKPGHIARNYNASQCPKCGIRGHVMAQCYGNRPRGGSGSERGCIGRVNAREPSDESGDTPTQKADEDLGSSEDTGFVAESKRRKNCVDSNSAMGGISFMQNGVRSDMPIFGGDAQRWHKPFELYVTCPKFTVEAGTGLIGTGAQISLVRRKSLKRLPKENIVETSVTMQGITGSCRSLTQGIYLEINESKPFLFYIVDELPQMLMSF
ncbi:hypothetical protein B7P43_G17394 [Cryptotermes secundus]|uniref:CCHC-type domain-containing protein n=1 Tax=Cryptotermes secundus TaxID=105785 RepID=A0A2J7R4F5_9NEOP|nr:hypothetical protein B7P43_G17394 [Cryptotermes secundus]